MYSTYGEDCESRPSENRKILVLGSGPNRIGQGIEFDYCCVHASLAMQEEGIESIMVNCNPETVSTDYDVSDRLYFEPITSEKILELNDLTQFFKSFHDICKKYNVGYNLMYSTDKNEGDFDLDVYNGSIFNTGSSKVIRLYKRIDVNNKLGFEFKPLIGTELYEGLMVPVNQKMAKKMQMGVKFYAPIKIQ